jgi:prepilin-type N-terminal cleavage/methylation domain-containing protein
MRCVREWRLFVGRVMSRALPTDRDRSDAGARIAREDDGFTMIELMVVMVIASALMAIGVFSLANYQKTSQQRGTAREVVSQLRNASERAISEGRTYCIDIAPDQLSTTTWQRACGPAGTALGDTARTQSSRVTLEATVTNPTPPPACPTSHQCIYFYPRGTATPATVVVRSSARAKTYTVTVEGLTARVFSPEL